MFFIRPDRPRNNWFLTLERLKKNGEVSRVSHGLSALDHGTRLLIIGLVSCGRWILFVVFFEEMFRFHEFNESFESLL